MIINYLSYNEWYEVKGIPSVWNNVKLEINLVEQTEAPFNNWMGSLKNHWINLITGINTLQRHLCCWPQTVSKPLVCQLTFLIRGYVKVSYFQIVFLVSSLSTKKRTKTSQQILKTSIFVWGFFGRNICLKKSFQICLTFSKQQN